MNKSSIDFPQIIKKARDMTGYNQTEFADFTGIGKTTLSNYEKGYSTPSWENVELIADALNISMGELIALGEKQGNIRNLTLPRNQQVVNDRIIPILNKKMIKLYFQDVPFGGADKFVSLPGSMLAEDGEYICYKATDNSMKADNISANSYLFVKVKSTVSDNDIVVAQNPETGDVFVRKFVREGHIINFIPSRVTEKAAIIKTDERDEKYRIIGVVKKILCNV